MLPQLLTIIIVFIRVICHNEGLDSKALYHEDLVPAEDGYEERGSFARDSEVKERRQIMPITTASNLKDKNSYCENFRTCFECLKSAWHPCDWCHNLGCTSMADKLCPYATVLHASGNILKVCPYIQHEGPILVPSGIRSHITVKLRASDPMLYDMDVICQIKLKNRLTHLKGMILKDSIHCYPVMFDTSAHKDTIVGSFRVIWGGVEPYSNELPISVYSCEYLADDCETCKTIGSEFGCSWCDGLNSCVTANKCDDIVNWSLNKLKCKYVKKKMYYV